MSNKLVQKKPARSIQKLISFSENDMDVLKNEISDGWKIVSLMSNGSRFVGVVEQNNDNAESLYIPPRKKIKFLG
jgi:hypothetical protein